MDNDLHFDEFDSAGREQWLEAAAALKGSSVEKCLYSKTLEGIDIQPIYDTLDLDSVNHLGCSPGKAPYLRGRKVSGNKVDPWWIAQDIDSKNPEEFNERMLQELMCGRNAVVFPTGSDFLNFHSVDALKVALKGIDLNVAPLFVWSGSNSSQLIPLINEAVGAGKWRGAVLADPIGETLKGITNVQLDASLNDLAKIVRQFAGSRRDIRMVGVQGHLWGDAGANAVDELAYTLATAVYYIKTLLSHGCSISQLAEQFVFSLSLGSDVFMQIAKLRAARLLWSKVFACFSDVPAPLFIHGRSNCFGKSQLDPHTNILRSTAEAFAGVIGGVDSMHIAPFDEVLGGNDLAASRLARNTQLLMAEECGFAEVADAAGGSWYVEKLTDQLARKVWGAFQGIEGSGGMLEALKCGRPQEAISKSAATKCKRISERRDLMVGVNLSPDLNERFESHRVGFIDGSADTDAMHVVHPLRFLRAAEGYERLRANASYASECPSVWLAKFGQPNQWSARAEFSREFFSIGGYEITENVGGADSYKEALESCVKSAAPVVVLCAADVDYQKIVPKFVPQLRHECPGKIIILAGYPTERVEEYRAVGVDEFIHLRSDCLSFLTSLNQRIGVSEG